MRTERQTAGVRASALWGRGGRGFLVAFAVVLAVAALVAPLGTASHGSSGPTAPTYVSPSLLRQADKNPGAKLRVIVQSSGGTSTAEHAAATAGTVGRHLGIVGAVAATVPAARLNGLAHVPGLTITPDSTVRLDAINYSTQLWPYADTLAPLWGTPVMPAPQAPTIAVVDSGIDAGRTDFAGRVAASLNFSTLSNNSPGDGRGHGTFVASIAAGAATGYAGAAPNAKILSLDVMDDSGMARTSDVIAAAQWILANKDTYNVRIANFSLHAATASNFTRDPLDRAVEKLWFGGVVVVAAAGNYAVNGQPSGVVSAPGNDPFVITVGAADLHGTLSATDDTIAPWSSFGYTHDGFWKPEVSAAGRYMVGAVPSTSTLYSERPDHVVAPGYMQLSGTSFAAPVVAGAAAQILARHPSWTPDQVKGALMLSARPLPLDTQRAGGVGEVNPVRAALFTATPPNPNAGLDQFVVADPAGGTMFDAVDWDSAAQSNAAWDSASWYDASWYDAAWDSASWESAAWESAAWSDVAWNDAAWEDAAWEDAAEGDAIPDGGYFLDPAQLEAAEQGALAP